jgi:hypothetical protein
MGAVVTSVDQVTPRWLTATLARGGHLPAGEVKSVALRRVHEEQLHSVSYFLDVHYAPGAPSTAPQHLFLKLPRAGVDLNLIAWVGEREVRLYEAVAPDHRDLPIIPCYDAVYDPEQRAYHLLLADLSATHDQPAWHLTIADHYITQTVEALAAFHAYWWEHPRLTNGLGDLLTPEQVTQEIARFQEGYVAFSRLLGERLSADDRRVYECVLNALPSLWESRTELAGQTLVHGDAHFWNFLYPLDVEAHRTYLLDWQRYHISPGTKDLAYTIVLRYPHRTLENERLLVRRYHEGLLRHGVANYSWETCWTDYRRLAAEYVLFPLGSWLGGGREEFWGLFIGRALAGFRDLRCAELLG